MSEQNTDDDLRVKLVEVGELSKQGNERLRSFFDFIKKSLDQYESTDTAKQIRSTGELSSDFASLWVQDELQKWGGKLTDDVAKGTDLKKLLIIQGTRQMNAHYGVE